MATRARPVIQRCTLDELKIEDARAFRGVGMYADLAEALRRTKYEFRVLAGRAADRADHAMMLNLTFWSADAGGDVLPSPTIPADVVAHAAWHHLAARALSRGKRSKGGKPSVDGLFLGEAIASAFDVYLVGRLLAEARSSRRSSFLDTQVPAMAEAAASAGLAEDAFEDLLSTIAADPAKSFAELRELLSDATALLFASRTAEDGLTALVGLERRRFAPLLHRYELSNWVLYARAYGDATPDPRARAVDEALRAATIPLDWLASKWVAPALA